MHLILIPHRKHIFVLRKENANVLGCNELAVNRYDTSANFQSKFNYLQLKTDSIPGQHHHYCDQKYCQPHLPSVSKRFILLDLCPMLKNAAT